MTKLAVMHAQQEDFYQLPGVHATRNFTNLLIAPSVLYDTRVWATTSGLADKSLDDMTRGKLFSSLRDRSRQHGDATASHRGRTTPPRGAGRKQAQV